MDAVVVHLDAGWGPLQLVGEAAEFVEECVVGDAVRAVTTSNPARSKAAVRLPNRLWYVALE